MMLGERVEQPARLPVSRIYQIGVHREIRAAKSDPRALNAAIQKIIEHMRRDALIRGERCARKFAQPLRDSLQEQ